MRRVLGVAAGLVVTLLAGASGAIDAPLGTMIPVFTVAYSVWLLDEPVGWELGIGGAFVLAGVYVGALRSSKTPTPTITPAIET